MFGGILHRWRYCIGIGSWLRWRCTVHSIQHKIGTLNLCASCSLVYVVNLKCGWSSPRLSASGSSSLQSLSPRSLFLFSILTRKNIAVQAAPQIHSMPRLTPYPVGYFGASLLKKTFDATIPPKQFRISTAKLDMGPVTNLGYQSLLASHCLQSAYNVLGASQYISCRHGRSVVYLTQD